VTSIQTLKADYTVSTGFWLNAIAMQKKTLTDKNSNCVGFTSCILDVVFLFLACGVWNMYTHTYVCIQM